MCKNETLLINISKNLFKVSQYFVIEPKFTNSNNNYVKVLFVSL